MEKRQIKKSPAVPKRFVALYLEDAVVERIEEFRLKHRLLNRAETVRRLINSALDQNAKGAKPD